MPGTLDWLGRAARLIAEEVPAVLVSVVEVRGSTPRGAGSKMLVTAQASEGSIGGGQLEHLAIAAARECLSGIAPAPRLVDFALGPELGQCCGGWARLLLEAVAPAWRDWLAAACDARPDGPSPVLASRLSDGAKALIGSGPGAPDWARELLARADAMRRGGPGIVQLPADGAPRFLLERLERHRTPLLLFGAGHTGQAVVHALAPLDFAVTWIDERAEIFPEALPDNVTKRVSRQPALEVEQAPPGACLLVMTHSHARDFEIVERAVRRTDLAYVGLIGSASKRAKFLQALRRRGAGEAAAARLTCPIGLPGVGGKLPAEIAVAVAAQLLVLRAEATAAAGGHLKVVDQGGEG